MTEKEKVKGNWAYVLQKKKRELGFSYEYLSAATGIPQATIRRYVIGITSPNYANFIKITNLLEIEL